MPLKELKLTPLGTQKPRSCAEINAAWKYLGATHKSVGGLFDALHVLRLKEQQTRQDARGKLSDDQQDLLRAALVFTSGGLDACLTRLLRDTLTTLIAGNAVAEKLFKQWVSRKLDGNVPSDMRQAILGQDPRERMVDLYVTAVSTPSLQATNDLLKVRDALGITTTQIPDSSVEELKPFFAARNEIVHELDLVDPTGPGTPSRRQRAMDAVREQCDKVLQFVETIIRATAINVRGCRSGVRSPITDSAN